MKRIVVATLIASVVCAGPAGLGLEFKRGTQSVQEIFPCPPTVVSKFCKGLKGDAGPQGVPGPRAIPVLRALRGSRAIRAPNAIASRRG